MEQSKNRRATLRPYGTTIAIVAASFFARWLADTRLHDSSPYLFFLVATIVAARWVDFFPTVFALLLGLLLSNWFFISPRHSLHLGYATNWADMTCYFFAGVSVAWFCKGRRDARVRATRQAQEAKAKRQEMEKTVAARTAAANESIQQLEAFAFSASHDLRAPLRAIKGFTIALREDYDPIFNEQGKDYSSRIVQGVEHMEELINALLVYSRVGREELPPVKVELEDHFGKLSKQWEPEVHAQGGRMEIGRPLPAVMANPVLLEQAMNHLISNALKFVPQGTAPRVHLEAEEMNGLVRIKVLDNGIGIEPQHRPKLFQIFKRLHPAEKYPGLGIGLAIVRKAANRMGGSAGLESEPGQGSCFWIDLPKAG